jgi:hypothetical protein
MMSTEQREERRLRFYQAASAVARERHGKEFHQLTAAEGVEVVNLVTERRPELRASFDEPYEARTEAPPALSNAGDWSLRPATRTVAQRFGFSQADLDSDPLRKSLVGHIERAEAPRDEDAVAVAFAEAGKRWNLDPGVYAQKQEIARRLARAGHPITRRA